jgi:UDP-N-acetylmuramoyl-tripeptide--D-alanyl-D-alanine ligase
VVGSYGKTTTARAVSAALGERIHPKSGRNAKSAVGFAVFRIKPHRPYAVIEVGIDAVGQMSQLARAVRPKFCVVTSVGTEHHRSIGSFELKRNEKAEMVRALPDSGLAVLNGDDPNVLWMAGQTGAKVVTFGFDATNDVRAEDVRLDWPHGTRFRLTVGAETREVRVRLMGRHMVYPALAAVALARSQEFRLDDVLSRLEALDPTPGRLSLMRSENGAVLLCDYFKSSYETIEVALDVLEDVPAARKIVVLGEVSEPPGSQGPIYRALAERVAALASTAIFLGSNFQRYKTGAVRAGLPKERVIDGGKNIAGTVDLLQEIIQPGDVVFIKGRDTQRLDRIALALAGRQVRCDLSFCKAMAVRCETCPMLERGWEGLRPLF